MAFELKVFQEQAATSIARRFAFFNSHPDRPYRKKDTPAPFYQALSAITGAGKTPILAKAVAGMCLSLPAQPIVFWMSKAKSVVGQTYTNFIEGGKYNPLIDEFNVIRARELNPNIIEDSSKALIVLSTTGLFNSKDQADGKLNIYKVDEDLFGNKSPWQRLIERSDNGKRRPLIIVYDEGHNLSLQQADILAELEPDAYLLASATMQLPQNFASHVLKPMHDWLKNDCRGEVEALKALGAINQETGAIEPSRFATTVVDSAKVVEAQLIKKAIYLGGTTSTMESCLDELHVRLGEISAEAKALGLNATPKAIYVCKTNINDDGTKDDPGEPFAKRMSPPIRIWRYLVDTKKVDPNTVAIYANLEFKKNKPAILNLFSKGESDFDAFQAGDFQHIIFNLGLQEGWDDPACYLGYIDKSMGSKIQVEQVIGRVLRQYGAEHYSSPLLNSAHFFIRVDKQNVFNDTVAAVKAKLKQTGATIDIRDSFGPGGKVSTLFPKPTLVPSAVIHQINLDSKQAKVDIGKHVGSFLTIAPDSSDAMGEAQVATHTLAIENPTEPTALKWTAKGHTNKVRLRWLISTAIRQRSKSALAITNLKDAKFDVAVEADSNAHLHANKLAADIISSFYNKTNLEYESTQQFTFGPMRVKEPGVAYTNALYERYSKADLNTFEALVAEELDETGLTWHRNPSNGGFSIPLLAEGETTAFFPDFIVWKAGLVFCVDTKGGHLLSDAVARKLFDIHDGPTVKLKTRFITRGKQTKLLEKPTKDGYTVWKSRAGSPEPVFVDTLSEAISESLNTA